MATLASRIMDDAYWMRQAIAQAKLAQCYGEVPVGAILVDHDNHLIAGGYNQPIRQSDPSAHAEIIVLREAARLAKNYRLPGTTLYVTLEPCAMCAGALILARVRRIVFAASDLKTGAAGSVLHVLDSKRLNHRPLIEPGVLAKEAGEMLSHFFKKCRKQNE